MTMQSIRIIPFLLALFVFVIGCDGGKSDSDPNSEVDGDESVDGDDDQIVEDGDESDDDDDSVKLCDEEVDQGIFWLENGETYFAFEQFELAMEKCPEDNRAKFGAAFTSSLYSFDEVALLVSVISGAGGMVGKSIGDSNYDLSDPEDFNEFLQNELIRILGLIKDNLIYSIDLYTELKGKEFSFPVNNMPVFFNVTQISRISGEIDGSDVYIFDGMSRMLALLFEFLHAHSLQTDLATVIFRVVGDYWSSIDVNTLQAVITYLLIEDERFLDFDERGFGTIENTKLFLMGALEDVVNAAGAIEAETDDQTDDLFTVAEDDGEKKVFLNTEVQNADTLEFEKFAIEIITANTVAQASLLTGNINGSHELAPFDVTIMPLIASGATLAIGFGILKPFNFDLGMDLDIITPSILASLIKAIFKGDKLAFDFGNYYGNPVPLRDMMPAWSTDQPNFENHLYLEWECPGDLLDGAPEGGFMCAEDAEFEDAGHFIGTPYEIDTDGLVFRTPYIAMRDPSFGGLLYVDVNALELEGYPAEPDFQMADQKIFNAILGDSLLSITGLMDRK